MTVYLVGAGPGDPGLLTRRGAELLARADVVVHDRLGTARVLGLARAGARLVDVGKAPGRAALDQTAINELLVGAGAGGGVVVRLKGGDPLVFGRGGEEAEALLTAGIPFEIVPGVTSAIAAPAYAGVPVTHRGLSTHVTIVTGHEDPAKAASDTDWAALARAGGTLVILMGAGRVAEIASALIAGGRAPATPVAAVRSGTTPAQRTIRTTLEHAATAGIEAPSAIVVGPVAALDLAWFENRPLFGRTIVVTRAREQASELRVTLEGLGADVVELPSIQLQPVDFTIGDVAAYEWVVFTSANGVEHFFTRGLHASGRDTRALASTRVAAIGPGTARALERHGVRADLVPARFVAESLLEAFPPPAAGSSGRVLLARAETARDVLPAGLRESGYAVDVLAVYRTVAVEPDRDAVARVRAGAVDAVTFTSSSTVHGFCDAIGEFEPGAGQPLVVSIGPVTSAAARACGLRVDVEATAHDLDGVVAALLAALRSSP